MPKLDVTKNYADNQSPVESDFDAIIDDIEVLLNTVKLDDDNFMDGGITASTKIQPATISAGQIRNNNITTAKINDENVTTDKLQDDSVTTAKIAANAITSQEASELSGKMPVGAVRMFHTFNSSVAVPRGWMVCNGNIVNETNYDSLHGVGTYTTDGISGSAILSKTLPNMNGKYAIGVEATTKDGAGAIASVGNTSNQADLSHTHDTSHDHTVNSSDPRTGFGVGSPEWDIGLTTAETNVESSSGLSATTDIQPESIQVLFIMRVI